MINKENQFKTYTKVEDRYFARQLEILKKVFEKQGYKNLKFKDTRGTQLDMKHGIDLMIKGDICGGEKTIKISLRCRQNTSYRDITIRRSASFNNGMTELDKIKNGTYEADIICYFWFVTNLPEFYNLAIVSTKEIANNINKYDIDDYIRYNVRPDGTPDGSSMLFIPCKHLNLLKGSYIN